MSMVEVIGGTLLVIGFSYGLILGTDSYQRRKAGRSLGEGRKLSFTLHAGAALTLIVAGGILVLAAPGSDKNSPAVANSGKAAKTSSPSGPVGHEELDKHSFHVLSNTVDSAFENLGAAITNASYICFSVQRSDGMAVVKNCAKEQFATTDREFEKLFASLELIKPDVRIDCRTASLTAVKILKQDRDVIKVARQSFEKMDEESIPFDLKAAAKVNDDVAQSFENLVAICTPPIL